MIPEYPQIAGDVISQKDLTIEWASDVAYYIASGIPSFVSLVECRRSTEGKEIIIIDVEVELGQYLKNDISRVERIAAVFSEKDSNFPEVFALRENFPSVPHRNLREFEFPRSLCLFEEHYEDIKLIWSAPFFITRICDWLTRTAKGVLHDDDQPLEPLLSYSGGQVIVPYTLFSKGKTKPVLLLVKEMVFSDKHLILIVKDEELKAGKHGYIALPLQGNPQVHGIVNKLPLNVAELSDLLATVGIDLLSELRQALQGFQIDSLLKTVAASQLLLLLSLPKKRSDSSPPESDELWAFILGDSILQTGIETGVWAMNESQPGRLIPPDKAKDGRNIKILPMKVTFSFSRSLGAYLNGIPECPINISLVGVGALGSQVFMNLVRAGYGKWTLIDNDIFLPHNLARHSLTGNAVGYPKAICLEVVASSILDEDGAVKRIVADVMQPLKLKKEVQEALEQAEVIIDASASISVARFLCRDIEGGARRISVFLNPTGNDLVILAEDEARKQTLDCLEMQYYRHIVSDQELNDHLTKNPKHRRYTNSCRDVSSIMSQDMMSLHAAICSHNLRSVIKDKDASISIFRANENLEVRRYFVRPHKIINVPRGKWTIVTDDYLIEKVSALRKTKLPKETGGVLIGDFDMKRKIIYVVDTIPSPKDSEEWPNLYIRGCQDLKRQLDQFALSTLGRLRYIGEWHSHPNGVGIGLSGDDTNALATISSLMVVDGFPATMLIFGEYDYSFYLGYKL